MIRRPGELALVLLLAAACSTAPNDTAAAPPTDATTTTGPATTTTSPAMVSMSVDPCDLVTAEEVATATGHPVAEVQAEPPIDCVFTLDVEPAVRVVVTIEDGAGRLAGPANLFTEYGLLVDDGDAAYVDGVGGSALCCPFRAIAVDAGDGRFIAISVGGGYNALPEPLDALSELARIAVGRL